MQDRTLTIQETEDTYKLRHQGATSKPTIRLQGAWLREAGFYPRDQVQVYVSHQRLVIEVLEADVD